MGNQYKFIECEELKLRINEYRQLCIRRDDMARHRPSTCRSLPSRERTMEVINETRPNRFFQ